MRRPVPQTSGLSTLRNAAIFLVVVVALFLMRFFQAIFTPLVVAMFLLLLIDAVAKVMHHRLPRAPAWARNGAAGVLILAAFAVVGGIFALEAPPFASRLKNLEPRIDTVLGQILGLVGAPAITLEQLSSGVDPTALLARIFSTARTVISYGVLVIIYFGFLLASRAAFGRKLDRLYDTEDRRGGARRVMAAVRDAVERYVRLQTFKALIMALVAWAVVFAMGVHDPLFLAFVVFLAAYVPIIGPIAGSLFPGLMALVQFGDLAHPAILVGVLGGAVFTIDNVLMPKLASDELNVDPLLVLISIGFWGAILGAPGILLSTPLTVTVMAIAAEFQSTRWLAVLISREGEPLGRSVSEARAPSPRA
ncbi:MAG: AI-2E family transporter [Caulobacteraceae bacterium]